MNEKTRKLCITAMGIALFVVTSLCLQVPIFENYYICLGYVIMMVFLYSVGTISGTLVGFLGVILYCICISGLRGMPGWSLGNIVIGILLGLCFKQTKKLEKKYKILAFSLEIAAIIIATTIGIMGIKSIVEYFLYAQPIIIRMASNVYAYVADILTMIMALPLCKLLDKKLQKFL